MRQLTLYSLILLLIGCVKSNPVPTSPPLPFVIIPNAPTDFKGILSSSTQIDLTWSDASNNEDGFKVERKSGTDAFALIATLAQNVVTFSDKSFTSGPTYTYRVYSYNSKGNSSNSNEIAVKTEDAEIALLKVGLLAFYPFTGNAGDSSGNGNHGIVNGATLTTDRFGNGNKAYNFNGSNYIRINGIDFSKSSEFSLSVWVKPSDISSNRYYTIIRQEGPSGNFPPDFLLAFQEYGTILSFGLTTGSKNYLELDLPINKLNYTDNKWHNILITYNGSNKSIYLDGNFIGNQMQSGNINYNNTIASVGSTSATLEEFFYGFIDDLRIYNRVLTSAEITYLHNH